MGAGGKFWTAEDIKYGQLPTVTHQIISIDPAVTDKVKSDYTALAVVGYDALSGRCMVREALAIKVPPGDLLRDRVADLLDRFPGVAGVLVESNQGGDLWRNVVFKDLKVPVRAIHNKIPKAVRAARLLHHYQVGKVLHERPLGMLEGQLVAFPIGPYDDLVDAVGTGVETFLKPKKLGGITRQVSYI
jgi:phage terminase large subunit-like protein